MRKITVNINRALILRKLFLIVILFISLLTSYYSFAQSFKKQGTLLYYFSKFIQWPEDYSISNQAFVIGVYGDVDVYEGVAKAMEGRRIGEQKVKVKRFSTISHIKDCHLLYIAPNKSSNFYRAADILKNDHTLIVTQKGGLGKKGSHINLTIIDGKMKFELNKHSIASTGLKVSNALITQAIIIK